jgi:hypothetical protein
VVLDDTNPASPEGWWTAVDTLAGHCIVVMIRAGAVDLNQTRPVTSSSRPLLNADHALSAALPVITDLTE